MPKPENGKPSVGKLKALYCVPNGDNPTGIRYTPDRKREIYRLAQEYNFLIIEDDAYFYLEERPLSDSFLSMDVDGRVIRLETFSKTVAPGLRLGFALVPKPLFKPFKEVSHASTQGSSMVSQMLLIQLIRKWGIDGYLNHCEEVNEFYAKRRRICEDLAKTHLDGLAEWESPTGGMFLWIKLKGITDSLPLIKDRLMKRKVLILPGADIILTGFKGRHGKGICNYRRRIAGTTGRIEVDIDVRDTTFSKASRMTNCESPPLNHVITFSTMLNKTFIFYRFV